VETPVPRPIHFEIHAADPERVQRFYGALFGWSFTPVQGMPYHLIHTGTDGEPGIDGGLVRRIGPNPAPQEPTPVVGYVCTINVDDLDGSVEKAVALGGVVALPKMAVPGFGWLAYCKDSESNVFGMMQLDPSAA
jgi:predicted enzyme related to lactoylglutathione lyase